MVAFAGAMANNSRAKSVSRWESGLLQDNGLQNVHTSIIVCVLVELLDTSPLLDSVINLNPMATQPFCPASYQVLQKSTGKQFQPVGGLVVPINNLRKTHHILGVGKPSGNLL